MTGALVKTLVRAGVYLGVSELLLKGRSGERRVRDIAIGVAFLLLAACIGFLAVAGALAAIFFALSEQQDFIRPAIIVALIAAALVVALFWEGLRRIKGRNSSYTTTRR